MSQKASSPKNLADLKKTACDLLRDTGVDALMSREKALDLIGHLWETQKEDIGPMLAA
jgi:hypothetical protein